MIKYRSSINPDKVYEMPVEQVENQIINTFYSPTKMEDLLPLRSPQLPEKLERADIFEQADIFRAGTFKFDKNPNYFENIDDFLQKY